MHKELLLHQWSIARKFVLELFEKTDTESFYTIPEGFKNNLHWQFGHVACIGELLGVLHLNNEDSIHEKLKPYFEYGTSPDNFDDNTPTIDEIHSILKNQLDKYRDVESEKFDVQLDEPDFFGCTSVAEFTAFLILHEGIHVGKIEEMQRFL